MNEVGSAFRLEIIRASPELVDVVAQLVWIAARERRLARAPADEAGLVPLLVDAPLAESEALTFEAGLDALLREESSRMRGVYLREVRDASGARRELGLPVAPPRWGGELALVGPFSDEAAADAWRHDRLPPPLVGDTVVHDGRAYVDVFSGEAGHGGPGGVVDSPDGGG